MDIYPQTDFPDIRKKATLHSNNGNLLVSNSRLSLYYALVTARHISLTQPPRFILKLIPREGDSLVRCYIELPHGTVAKSVNLADLHETAKRIFRPYVLNIADTFWWSAYMIGQRIVDHFHKDNRIFLTGDACHTHSPKAGQGMNVSLQDGYNIGWKLAAVLKGRCSPKSLETYNLEREKVASDLIDFDRRFTKLFSSANKDAIISHGPEYFADQFIQTGKYTAGLTATYDDSMLMCGKESTPKLASGLVVGMRFPSTQVVRFADAKAMQLVKMLPIDGRWRIIVFAGNLTNAASTHRLKKVGSITRLR
jgi:phenol 2-monooxygenase